MATMLTSGREEVSVLFGAFLLEPQSSMPEQYMTMVLFVLTGVLYSFVYPGLQGSRDG